MPERSPERSKLPLTEEQISRRNFLRRASYVLGVGSAFMVGGGAGMAINAEKASSETISSSLKDNGIYQPTNEEISLMRYTGILYGTGISIAGLIFAYVSYQVHKENK